MLEQHGVSLFEIGEGGPMLAVCGVGKVAAAHGAMAMLAAGARGLLMVGTGGAISRDLKVGDLVHGSGFVQADLAVREGRETPPYAAWSSAWQNLAPGREGLILSADRPVMGLRARSRLRKAYSGTLLADMEAAAIAAVCLRAKVPFAALKVVTDFAGFASGRTFARHFADEAGRPARTLASLWVGGAQSAGQAAFPFPDGSNTISG